MRKQLLVAGGGIGGLAAALGASHAGWQVRLYERATAFSEVGAGVQLGPHGVRCLQDWGLEQPLQAVVSLPDRLQVRCALTGRELAALPLGRTAAERYGAAYATIHRADLHDLLLTALTRCTGARLQLGQAVEDFTDTDGAVTLRTNQGEAWQGDALIGADGLWSHTRVRLLGAAPPRVTGHLAYRALVPQSALPDTLRTGHVSVWLGPRLHAVQYPVRRGELQNLVLIVQGPAPQDLENWDHAANAAGLEQALQGCCRALQDLVHSVSAAGGPGWRLWPLCDRPPVRSADEMARGLVGLLGDAAHPMPPYLAQGAGMALEDARALQRALGMHALDVPQRLRRYALSRWQRNARVQARSIRNGRIFHATGPLRRGRDLALRLLGERLLDMPWLYRGDGP
ncbi:FAD-dependent monooxygenase [Verminephrobacter aporrectodeae]|uniref:FAD-dependent monooxygenase n=1 Tax=Verminephrobacter aporrectodeae TaxID=1110389 RepID=UPI0022434386|nr:FAD-dependent monooxygenase [Verminephrobacter aporrectodeae]MCW8176301.1 FAD-dependent oxidoreductase [Verminephrobacter aporrectodeae subsp. tuberculatae]MCW8203941.1 FAD-dependent oxidoreductase [Verminephrobacter aporrectodeae subsp. tuberculatae]